MLADSRARAPSRTAAADLLPSRLVLLWPGLLTLACAGVPAPVEWAEERPVHGVSIEISVREADETSARAAIDAAFATAEEVGQLLLASHPGSEIDILAKVPSHLWLEVQPTTYAALTLAMEIAETTDGAYDPTWKSLLRVWGLAGRGPPRVPRDFEIDMALRRVDWTDVELSDEDGLQARRLNRRTALDLDGLAEGAIVDAAVARLRELGVAAGRASTRDQHAFFGGSPSQPWSIAVFALDATVAHAKVAEGGLAVVSRGALVVADGGAEIHDRLDPRSGRPADDSLWVAVTAERASASAAFAAAIFAMGAKAPDFVAAHGDLRAATATSDGESWASPGMDIVIR
jgi:thiamine biosynthesis lipoprotein